MASDLTFLLPLNSSENFTAAAISKITALFHAIEYSELLGSSLTGCATRPLDKNGVDVVGVPPSSDTTLIVIMPYATLLLSCLGAPDASTVESLTSFIKTYTGERGDIIRTVNQLSNPMSSEETRRLVELEEVEFLLQNLREIACGSDEGETVRLALLSLSQTEIGREYLKGNPIRL